MKKIVRNIFGLMCAGAVMAGFAACSSDDGPDDGGSGQQPPREFPESISESMFAVNCIEKIAEGLPADDNIVISPLSISHSVSMAANGADGNTLREMLGAIYGSRMTLEGMNGQCALQLSSLANMDPADGDVKIANSIWVDSTFPVYDDFISKTKDVFAAEIHTVDDMRSSAVKDEINSWVSDVTGGKIRNLLSRNFDSRGAALVNAFHLFAKWVVPFDPAETTDGEFTTSSGMKVKSRMMRNRYLESGYTDASGFKSARLYLRRNMVMEIILPDEGETPMSVIPKLISNRVPSEAYKIDISIPKFTAEYGSEDFVDIMRSLGISDAFDRSRSDFSKLSPVPFYISRIVHKTCISVDEIGVEASSATSTSGESSAGVTKKVSFTVDRPFLFFVRDTYNGSVLFCGIINKI